MPAARSTWSAPMLTCSGSASTAARRYSRRRRLSHYWVATRDGVARSSALAPHPSAAAFSFTSSISKPRPGLCGTAVWPSSKTSGSLKSESSRGFWPVYSCGRLGACAAIRKRSLLWHVCARPPAKSSQQPAGAFRGDGASLLTQPVRALFAAQALARIRRFAGRGLVGSVLDGCGEERGRASGSGGWSAARWERVGDACGVLGQLLGRSESAAHPLAARPPIAVSHTSR